MKGRFGKAATRGRTVAAPSSQAGRLPADNGFPEITGAGKQTDPWEFGKIMAQNATIYKTELSVSDMDRHYYETHKLTVAKHPSETDERLMVRIVAFALNAHEHLEMTKGLSTDDEPDIWQKSLSGEIDLWVALGLPSEKVIRQSCSKATKVIVYSYGGRTAEMWWN